MVIKESGASSGGGPLLKGEKWRTPGFFLPAPQNASCLYPPEMLATRLEVKRRPVESFAKVESPLIRKVRE